jgi:hypothetical protein
MEGGGRLNAQQFYRTHIHIFISLLNYSDIITLSFVDSYFYP